MKIYEVYGTKLNCEGIRIGSTRLAIFQYKNNAKVNDPVTGYRNSSYGKSPCLLDFRRELNISKEETAD